ERHEIAFLLVRQLQREHQVEEFDRILEGGGAPVVEVRRGGLDSPPGEALDRSISRLLLQESLRMAGVDPVVPREGRRVAARTLRFAEEELVAANLGGGRLRPNEPAGDRVELGRRGKIEHVLQLRHVADLYAVENVHAFFDGMNLITVEIRG